MNHRIERITVRTWASITVAAFLFSIGWAWWSADRTEDGLRAEASRERSVLSERITVLEDSVRLCREQPAECREEVPPPEQIAPQVGPGPSQEQMRFAALTYLPRIVEDYLEKNPPKPGEKGDTGEDGEDGDPGQDGADGEPGQNGTDGKDGRGISSVQCSGMSSPATFTITYTDGTVQTVECEMLPPVEE